MVFEAKDVGPSVQSHAEAASSKGAAPLATSLWPSWQANYPAGDDHHDNGESGGGAERSPETLIVQSAGGIKMAPWMYNRTTFGDDDGGDGGGGDSDAEFSASSLPPWFLMDEWFPLDLLAKMRGRLSLAVTKSSRLLITDPDGDEPRWQPYEVTGRRKLPKRFPCYRGYHDGAITVAVHVRRGDVTKASHGRRRSRRSSRSGKGRSGKAGKVGGGGKEALKEKWREMNSDGSPNSKGPPRYLGNDHYLAAIEAARAAAAQLASSPESVGKVVEVHVFSEGESDAPFAPFEALCPPRMDPGNPLEYGEWGAHTWAGPVAPAVHRGYYLPEEEEDAAALAAADYGGFDRRRHGWGPDGQEGQERRRRRRLAPVTRCKLHLDSDEVEAWAAFVHADVLVLSKSSFSYTPALYRPRRLIVNATNTSSSTSAGGDAAADDGGDGSDGGESGDGGSSGATRGKGAVVYAPFWLPPFSDWLPFDLEGSKTVRREEKIDLLADQIRGALLHDEELPPMEDVCTISDGMGDGYDAGNNGKGVRVKATYYKGGKPAEEEEERQEREQEQQQQQQQQEEEEEEEEEVLL